MPNQLINIGGENRPVNFGRNFWSEVELLTGKPVTQLLDIKELTSIRNQIAIAFSALKWGLYDPKTGNEPDTKFTKNQVGDWIDEKPESMQDFYRYLTDSLPKKKEGAIAERQ